MYNPWLSFKLTDGDAYHYPTTTTPTTRTQAHRAPQLTTTKIPVKSSAGLILHFADWDQDTQTPLTWTKERFQLASTMKIMLTVITVATVLGLASVIEASVDAEANSAVRSLRVRGSSTVPPSPGRDRSSSPYHDQHPSSRYSPRGPPGSPHGYDSFNDLDYVNVPEWRFQPESFHDRGDGRNGYGWPRSTSPHNGGRLHSPQRFAPTSPHGGDPQPEYWPHTGGWARGDGLGRSGGGGGTSEGIARGSVNLDARDIGRSAHDGRRGGFGTSESIPVGGGGIERGAVVLETSRVVVAAVKWNEGEETVANGPGTVGMEMKLKEALALDVEKTRVVALVTVLQDIVMVKEAVVLEEELVEEQVAEKLILEAQADL
ncbi:unnamed protein product [Phytophthora fragariaefolia]|uniref:Unnamed protein product n=1 Tax=Phytophthora fragariaefolia TaxID=1490495 RepID=A0A9W7DA61_9STRA|nr:unnamed protein product [Phytophthora fragariaefolia]